MHTRINKKEKAQSLVIIAIAMIAAISLLALILDGGFGLMNRRIAQAAADAGALAGAREMCISGDPTQAEFMAGQYAIVHNDAQTADVTVDGSIVTVETHIVYASFLAGMFGDSEIEASAVAAAGCFLPGVGEGVLPTAWSCSPPISEGLSNSEDCQQQSITYDELQQRIEDAGGPAEFHDRFYPEMYIIMNSRDVNQDFYCKPYGVLQCDLDGDGDNELLADGDRSWLDLDGGGGGSSELVDWIGNGFPDTLRVHTWVGGQTGVQNNVFQAVNNKVGTIILVPVFNAFCDGDPATTTGCQLAAHPDGYDGEEYYIYSGGEATLYFHLYSFAAFYISCVKAPPYGPCPGNTLAQDMGVLDGNDKTIEGYFIRGFIPGTGGTGGGVDAGIYNVYLIR